MPFKGGNVSRTKSRIAALMIGCGLLAVVAGCSFHRTTSGFVLRSDHWTLEHNRDGSAERAEVAADATAEKPKSELLPWRSRLSGYRLGQRFFHGRDSDAETPTSATASDQREASVGVKTAAEPRRPDLVVD